MGKFGERVIPAAKPPRPQQRSLRRAHSVLGPSLPVPAGADAGMLGDGHPGRRARRAHSLPENHPRRQSAPPESKHPPFISPIRPKPTENAGAAAAHFQAAASRTGSHRRMLTHEGRENAAMVGDDAKQRSDSLTVSQTPDLRPNR
jgi:hypothetical protein